MLIYKKYGYIYQIKTQTLLITKKVILLSLLLTSSIVVLGQGRSISLQSKIKTPIVLSSNDTLKVGDLIELKGGSTENGDFKFVQVLNNMNEPISLASSRFAYTKQPIVFFKEQDGGQYAFTKYFCINIEPALECGEIKSAAITKFQTAKKEEVKGETQTISNIDKLRELKALLDEGILTQDEFNAEKAKILSK